ncbi:MAG TPA: glycosyltransferase [Planktothrix sp.]|jgi:glycosyltransferase involved in cell wall biosynthesis
MNAGAKLSVVVVSFNEAPLLERCLRSLAQQEGECELIVVRDSARMTADIARVRAEFARFAWLEAPARSTVPAMRTVGIEQSSGDVIALTEDDCIVSTDWCARLRQAHDAQKAVAIGGPVQPGDFSRALDWGVFFCEYARFMPPYAGIVRALAGNNMSYKRVAIDQLKASEKIASGFYEVFVNSSLQQSGHELYAEESLAVSNNNSWSWSNVTTVPYNHGRGFAGSRFSSLTKRLPYLGVSLLLPALQTLRVCRQVISRKRHLVPLVRALPVIALFWSSWSVGEFMGYLLGPGRSLEEWR